MQSQTEQVRGIPTVWARDDIAAKTGGASRTAVAAGTTVDESSSQRAFRNDVAGRVRRYAGPDALDAREFALKELAAAADGARRIPFDEVDGRSETVGISVPGSDLFFERLANRPTRNIRIDLRPIC